MAKQREEPRISVNKLAQYVTSRAARQNQILRNAKFPPDYITSYYRDASETISRFLAGGMTDFGVLENSVAALSQKVATNVYETRRIAGTRTIRSSKTLFSQKSLQSERTRAATH